MRTLSEQIREAFERSGMSVAELLQKSGLDIERSGLHRKLSGEVAIRTNEAEALANALGITLAWVPDVAKSGSAA